MLIEEIDRVQGENEERVLFKKLIDLTRMEFVGI
jgi:hypothetical protein